MKFLYTLIAIFIVQFSIAQSWQDVGGGLSNSTHALCEWNGQLVVMGSFNNVPCDRVALWDGANYTCLGGGVGIVARAGCVWNGNLVVVGDFWNNFQPCVGCNGVAVWDGTSWTALDQGFNNDVLTCTVYNGDLIIGGDFTAANGVPINRVARWNETTQTFESMGGVTDMDNDVRCMTVYDGELWVGGDFNNIGGQGPLDGVVKWDETNDVWVGGNSGVDLIGGVNETVRVLYVNPNDGNLYMGGEFPELWDGDAAAEDFNMSGVAMYDGSNWYPLGTGLNEYCRAIHEYNGDLIVGGYFTTADGVACNKIAKWNTTTQTFSPMGQGFDAVGIDEYVKAAWTWNGIFFAGGAYTQAEGQPMNYIAQWYEAPTQAPTAAFTASSLAECEGSCIDFADNSTNGPTSWSWTFPGASTPSSTDQHPTNICFPTAGTYTVSLQACNGNGCNTTTQDITIGTTPTVTANDESLCDGGTVTLTATPSAGGGTYLWSPGGENTASIDVSPATTTTYTVEYTLNGCTSVPETATVTVTATPTVTVNSEVICEGTTVTLSATPSAGGGTYLWSPGGETTPTINVTPGSTTTYTVDYTLNGCTGNNTSSVTVNPVYNLNEAVTACENSSYTYPDGFTESITGNTAHTSTLTTVNGCDSIIVTNVTMNASYNYSENISVCDGTTITYPDGVTETISGNTSHTSTLTSLNGCDSVIVTNVMAVTAYNTSENVSVCPNEMVTYPDGTTGVITGNTTHTSTLVSSQGCDSLIVTNVTMNSNYNLSENVDVCEGNSITYPDGVVEVITVNTSHTSNLTTINGCDSVIVTNVAVNQAYNQNENVSVCEGSTYTYPDGFSETITNNTTHTSALSSVTGCDSIIVTNIAVQPNYNQTSNLDVCSGSTFTYPDGTTSTNITANESHTSVLLSSAGCDSIIVTNLTVNSVLNYTENLDICSGTTYTYPDGTVSNNITSNESHVSNFVSQNGCDSIITTNLNIIPVPTVTVNSETICEGETVTILATPSTGGGTYSWTPGGETNDNIVVSPTSTTTYTVSYTLNGCTSNTATSTVTVNPMPVSTVSEANNVLTADQGSANYQWLDCNNGNQAIAGETGQTYAPTANGSYAVEITLNGCTSTSACSTISTIGLDELAAGSISLYPNPVFDAIYLESNDKTIGTVSYNILDGRGRVVFKGDAELNQAIDIQQLEAGAYFIEFNEGELGRLRFVKQ